MTEKKRYRPANSSEGDEFMTRFCDRCSGLDREDGCSILIGSMLHAAGDDACPEEWVYGDDERPTCTAFEEVS